MTRVQPTLGTVYHVAGHIYADADAAYELSAALMVFHKYDPIMPRSEMPLELFRRLACFMKFVDRTKRLNEDKHRRDNCDHMCDQCGNGTLNSHSNGRWCSLCGRDV